MDITNAQIIYFLAIVLGIIGIVVFTRKEKKVAGFGKNWVVGVFIILALGLVAFQQGYLVQVGLNPLAVGGTGVIADTTSTGVITSGTGGTYQPTATFTAKDKYATTIVTGASWYKRGSNAATTTAISNVNAGESIQFWIDNSTFWVQPAQGVTGTGVTSFQANAFANGSATITLYDLVNRKSTDGGAYNTSMGANDQANLEITYQGTSKASAMPFGGVMVLEYNATISSVTCNGDDLLTSSPYQVTYTPTATTNTYKVFAVGPTIDDGTGSVRKITCQYQNGASANANSPYYVKFLPANYYVTQAGNILLDVEKAADSSTTRVGSVINQPSTSAFWGA